MSIRELEKFNGLDPINELDLMSENEGASRSFRLPATPLMLRKISRLPSSNIHIGNSIPWVWSDLLTRSSKETNCIAARNGADNCEWNRVHLASETAGVSIDGLR